jgi:hypothetical protein
MLSIFERPDTGNQGGGTAATDGKGDAGGETAVTPPASFEDWLKAQPEAVRGLYDQHTRGLKSALDSERTQRADLARQVRDLSAKAEKGSETQKALEQMAAKLELAELRTTFYEDAMRPEIGCTNPRLAMLAAQEIGAIDQKGRINWETIRKQFPELFVKRAPDGKAGAGTGSPVTSKVDMNQMLRRAAGREQ